MMIRRYDRWAVFLLLAAVCVAALGQDPDFPQLTGRVVDNAAMLSPATEKSVSNRLKAHEQATGEQVVVVTLPDLQGFSIEEFGYQLGRHWGIGEKDKDTGALLIVAQKERAIRIEVGYGLEGRLTDARSQQIISGIISPRFKQGDFDVGVSQGVTAILTVLGGGELPAPVSEPQKKKPSPLGAILMALVILMMFGGGRGLLGGLFLGSMLGGRGGFGGGGFGGGGFGGGGGGFGGGGASGGW